MPDFIDRLVQLNTQNFLGGLAQGAQAEKEAVQNEAIGNLYKSFSVKKNELKTRDEVLTEVNQDKDLPGVIKSAEDLASDKMAKASTTLFKSLSNIGSYQDLYSPYITAFATLGDEGIKIANTLSKELADKIQLEDSKGKTQYIAMQYANLELETEMNAGKLIDYLDLRKKNKTIEEVERFITETEIFNSMSSVPSDVIIGTPKGDKLIAEYDTKYKALVNTVKGQFPNLSSNELSLAVATVLARNNKALKASQSDSLEFNKYKLGMELSEQRKKEMDAKYSATNMALSVAQDFTNWFNQLSSNAKEAIRFYSQTGVRPSEALRVYEKTGEFPKGFRSDALIGIDDEFIKNAQERMENFDVANEQIRMTFGDMDWFSINEKKSKYTSKDGKSIDYSIKVPMVNGTENIIRADNSIEVFRSGGRYNPAMNEWTTSKLKKRLGEMEDASSFRTKQDTFTQDVQAQLKTIPGAREVTRGFEVFFNSIKQTIEKEKRRK